MKLKNSVSIITGGSSGLGEATVRKFHSLGSKVCIFDLDNDYKILQCSSSESDEEIKKKYFKLVKEYHPDTLVSKGLPEEFLKFANERLANINKAYDRIIKYRKDNSV